VTEPSFGDLVAEFRLSKFSGFRYLKAGWPLTTPGSPPTAPLRRHGYVASSERLTFVDNAKHDPEPPSSRIVEIKVGTCGDF